MRTITQTERRQHVTFGSNAYAGTATHGCFSAYFLPKVVFGVFNLFGLRVARHFFKDEFYLLLFKVDNVVHEALRQTDVAAEEIEVKFGFGCERIPYISVEVYGQQAAAVIGTERNLSARVGRGGAESQVGIAVRDALTRDGIPEQHSRFGAFPRVVDNFLPKGGGIDVFFKLHFPLGSIDRILLAIGPFFRSATHEFIVNTHRHIGAGHFALCHFGIDKSFGIGMFDAYRKHESTAAAILCHFARGIGETFHERHQSGGRKGRIFYGRPLGTYL